MKKSILALVTCCVFMGCFKAAEDLMLDRIDYFGNEIKIDGYYYHELEGDFHCFLLYNNGVYYNRHFLSNSLNSADNSILDEDVNKQNKQLQYVWGVYLVEGDKITIERWLPGSGGPYPTQILEGEIVDDETIRISGLRGTEYEDEVDEFKFRALSPKPDSTNTFIN